MTRLKAVPSASRNFADGHRADMSVFSMLKPERATSVPTTMSAAHDDDDEPPRSPYFKSACRCERFQGTDRRTTCPVGRHVIANPGTRPDGAINLAL